MWMILEEWVSATMYGPRSLRKVHARTGLAKKAKVLEFIVCNQVGKRKEVLHGWLHTTPYCSSVCLSKTMDYNFENFNRSRFGPDHSVTLPTKGMLYVGQLICSTIISIQCFCLSGVISAKVMCQSFIHLSNDDPWHIFHRSWLCFDSCSFASRLIELKQQGFYASWWNSNTTLIRLQVVLTK